MFEFFNQHTLDPNPLQIALTTYEDEHTSAYWGRIEIASPWSGGFGSFRASRDPLGNSLSVELSSVAIATFDLPPAELTVAPGNTLTLSLATTAPLTTTIVLNDDLTNVANATVLRDGTPVPGAFVGLTDTAISIGPLTVDAPTVLTISTTSDGQLPGQQQFDYSSSVDQSPLHGLLYVPPSYDPNGAPVALVCFLHGGGGLGTLPPGWSPELDARGWIFIAPDGRNWPLADPNVCPNNPNASGACSWCTSAAYLNNPFEPMVGPGEQDILDAINWAIAAFNIDPDHIYLTGFSMGGRGTYQIGLRNPDRFAAIAPLAPASDMYEIFVRRPDPSACKEGMVSDGQGGGQPNSSLITDTLYSITSGRFLIENAFNLPVFHGHGTSDTTACNIPPANGACPGTAGPAPPGVPQYRHGYHMLFDSGWSDCHWGGNQCFGHTPTLSELRTRHPSGYDWGYIFTNVPHTIDTFWATGGADTPTSEGIPSIANPGDLMGIFEFFDSKTLVHSPATVVYKSYTPEHRKAYWAEIDISAPWQDSPGALRARRDAAANSLEVELARVAVVGFDLQGAELGVGPQQDLTLSIRPLIEPAFDPALAAPGEPLTPTIVLEDDFSGVGSVIVLQGGAALPAGLVSITPSQVSIGPVDVAMPIALAVRLDTDGDGVADADDCAPGDGGAFASPTEIANAVFLGASTLSWDSAASSSGGGTVYDVLRGSLDELPVGAGGAEACLASSLPVTVFEDATAPPSNGFYYLVRGVNVCGVGSYGADSAGAERTSPACP